MKNWSSCKTIFVIGACALFCLVAPACLLSASDDAAQGSETPSQEKISLDLRGVEITELLRVLSLKTGLTIVPQQGVTGRVNLFVNNVRFEDVLDIILVSNNLACDRKGNIVSIMTAQQYYALYGKKYEEPRKVANLKLSYAKPVDVFNALSQLKSDIGKIIVDESSGTVILVDIPDKLDLMQVMAKELDVPPETETLSLKYATAKDLESKVSKALTPGTGAVVIDERTNKISIKDAPEKLKGIKRMLRAFDEEPSQVLIEAEIVELSLSEKFQRGVNWEKIFRGVKNLDFTGNFSLGLAATADQQQVSVGTLASDGFTAVMQMLQTYGRTQVLSSPRIAAVNNQEAKIMVGSREAYITQTLSTATTGVTSAESISFVDVGVKLNVTPSISRDGFVTMKIKPEVSSVREYLTTPSGSRVPIVNTSQAESTVKVKDGSMILIAGLTQKNELEQKSQTPVLGSIPLLGLLFSKEIRGSDQPKHAEFIVFITPHIITGSAAAARDAASPVLALTKTPKGFKDE